MGVGEAGLRGYYTLRGKPFPVVDASIENEREWAIKHLEAEGAILPSQFEFDETVGWRNRPNLVTDSVKINSQGMRSDVEFDPQPKPGRRRILLVGDSYTFGAFMTNQTCFAGRLATGRPDWDVLNQGVSGTGTDQQLLMFETYGRQWNADVVILGFFTRDYLRNLLYFRDASKPRFEPDGNGLRLTHTPVSPEQIFDDYKTGRRPLEDHARSVLVDSIVRNLKKLADSSTAPSSRGWALLSRIMTRFKNGVEDAGGKPLWLIIPERDCVDGPPQYAQLEELCRKHCESMGMAYLSLSGPFREHHLENPDVPLYRPRSKGGHLSAEGNALAAQVIEKFLAESLLPND